MTSNAPALLQHLGREFGAFQKIIDGAQTSVKGFDRAIANIGAGNARGLSRFAGDMERLGRIKMPAFEGFAAIGKIGAIDSSGLAKAITALGRLEKLNLSGPLAELERLGVALTGVVGAEERMLTIARETSTAWRLTASAMREGAAGLNAGRGDRASGGAGRTHSDGLLSPIERQTEHDLVGAGFMGGIAAHAIQRAIEAQLSPSFSASEAKARLMLGGFSKAEATAAENRAFEVQQSSGGMGATVLGNLDIARDLNAVFHSAADAMKMMPDLAAMGVVLGKVGKGDQIGELFKAAQAGELRGLNKPGSEELDTDKFGAFLHKLEMVAAGTGGRVGPSDYVNFLRQARGAGSRLSDEALFTSIPAAMMALRSNRAGTSLQSWAQSEYGHLAAGYADEQVRMGLVAPGGFTKNKSGSTMMKPGAVYHEDLQQSDPVKYILDFLIPQLKSNLDPLGKLGLADPKALQNAVVTELNRLYPRSTITGAVEEIALNPAMVQRAVTAFASGGAMDKTNYNNVLAENDAKLHLDAFSASWTAFLTAMGEGSTDHAVKLLDLMTGALNTMSNWARANPTLASYTTDVAVALGGLAVAISGLGVAALVGGPGLRTARSVLLGASSAAAAGGGAQAAAAAAIRSGGVLGLLASPLVGVPAATLGAAYFAGTADAPMVDDYGNQVGTWGRGAAPGSMPGGNTRGTEANPIVVHVQNQTSGRDIANGVTTNQARSLGAGPRASTGFDSQMHPSFSYLGTP